MIIEKFKNPEELVDTISRSKEAYSAKRKQMSFEEKLLILQKLQEKAYFFGRTKIKPWPIHQNAINSNHV